ncbi:nucleopolyhedrovirus P10 family protein [Streptomyces longispororuber]|uniref:nucleopolyhedrovirus P10 family protein n=1 Tax=Streptomyces longispororuber TaxID=68230 RepID=UPI00210B2964|nr:nucleopolyhedrovirus P10 family protein [Streptomyces longispororuber]MCQ4206143.1 nucleopolyhedrovirus P10 family protein [Streptomyces longispororuber]
MTADRWAQAVRQQLGLGRLLPLGGPGDGAWIAEPAAVAVLRRAVSAVRGVRLGSLRLALADPEGAYASTVPAPPSALPPGPLRIVAECAATADEPLPQAAARLRTALAEAADAGLGLVVTEVDLRVTALLDEAQDRPEETETPEPAEPAEPAEKKAEGDEETAEPASPASGPKSPSLTGDEARVAAAALAVPGVTRLTGALGGLGRAVHIEETGAATSLPRRHVRVELAVGPGHRASTVAGAVREAVPAALPDRPTVTVLVTEVSS